MKLKFLITVPDKYTKEVYEAGQVYEFDDKRAEEILKARTPVTKEPYAEEVVEPKVEMVKASNDDVVIETMDEVEVKPKKKKKKDN